MGKAREWAVMIEGSDMIVGDSRHPRKSISRKSTELQGASRGLRIACRPLPPVGLTAAAEIGYTAGVIGEISSQD